MSGVFGMALAGGQADLTAISDQMIAKMTHGDWFQVDRMSAERAQVVLGRIGIGIFNREPQPVWNDDHTIALLMAGQLHAHPSGEEDLSESDERLVLRTYERFGDRFASYLEGAFIVALWNQPFNQIIVANDRFGLYPLYYSHFNRRLIFAPEMKGIFCDPEFQKTPDFTALAEYMRFQTLLGEKTFFENVKLLPNASVLCYDLQENRLTVQSYWDFSRVPAQPKVTFNEAVEEASRLLREAVRKRTTGNYRYGVYLSGGLDSRLILGYLHQQKKPLRTITFGKPGSRDAVYARALARKVSADHHFYPFNDGKWVETYAGLHLDLTEGFQSWIHLHGISILEDVRKQIDVNLSGFTGLEIAYEDAPMYHTQDDVAFTTLLFQDLAQKTTWPSLDEPEERFLYSHQIAPQMLGRAFESFRQELAKFNHLPYPLRANAFSRLNPDRRMFQYYLVFHRAYIEMQTPFCDYDYMDFAYGIPAQLLFHRKLRKAVILKTMPYLAGVPYDKDNLPITQNEAYRIAGQLALKAKSYINRHVARLFPDYATLNSDYENWLRTDLRSWGEGILMGEQTLNRDIFSREFLESLWRRCQSGLEENIIGKIAPIMTWEMVMRKFYD